ncbi:putative virion structural protein [Salmonella phage pSal-SNUABM-04]|nr:putative virion structural protein [Salmonella phage pSal-SNUABM-04]
MTNGTFIMLAGGLRYCGNAGLCKPYNRVNAMSFKSKQNLLKLINKENKISPELTFDDVDISLPEVVSVDGRDSKVILTSKLSGDAGEQMEVFYHRRDLPDYILGDVTFDREDVFTTHDFIPALNQRYGLNLLPDDLEDLPVSGNAHTVIAEALSHEWRGQVTLNIVVGVPLADVIPNTQLDGLLYPDHQDVSVGQASLYSYDVDASSLKSWIPSLQAGNADMAAFAKAFSTVVPELWVGTNDAVPYNLQQAGYLYYKETAKVVGANPAFKYVLGLELSPLCTNFQGTLNLYFNN